MTKRSEIQARSTEAFEVVAGSSDSGVIVLCDHATSCLPARYGTLGLDASQFERHIAYDIGAQGVARRLAALLNAPAVVSCFSRLLIDPNRGMDDPTLIMRVSDGAVIPGNRDVDSVEREVRLNSYYKPYHQAITDTVSTFIAVGQTPILLSIHSFTPVWKGAPRRWHAAVLWDRDPRLAHALLAGLRREETLVVGDNEPYSGVLRGDTLWQHGTQRGLAHAIIEIRQDLISNDVTQNQWGDRLARIVTTFRSDPSFAESVGRAMHYGSWSI
jgi:predicted N-formylglutamate amidohydrolase